MATRVRMGRPDVNDNPGLRNKVARPGLWRLRHNTARPDVLAANEPQPIEPLLIGQADAVPAFAHAHAGPRSRWPILLSLPASRRPILARCMIHNSTVRNTKRVAMRRSSRNHSTSGVAALAMSAASEE
jgi:hypothetical protein